MRILLINGPNLNLLGIREPGIYGDKGFENYFAELVETFPEVELNYFQTNHEGSIIDKLHEVGFSFDGIVINAGAYTHTSVGIADAIAAIDTPVVEVHISNIHAREVFRHQSFMAKNCMGVICGFGLTSYRLAVQSFL
ncbi:type II 3-dehydroquinate dehydratase [Olivibacter sp. SDN3]|uniref:type II 3-dehydroquinate dehydratase n=1 Tax=Olivibacter sp. SDN3 TaxID=2764720 RepID=UPI001650F550|nr:type II 3-dehydroquinate dehydratase [Olivibacter sp. SDN3]QNL48440.1 type II 3-dehydroquinate dehydratase [Olivibacter sp. SDN3]